MSNIFEKVLFIVSSFIISYSELYVCSKLYRIRINYKCFLFYITLFFLTFFGILNYFYVSNFVRMLLNMLLFFICNYILFRKRLKEVIINTLYSEILMTLSDIVLSLVLIIVFKDSLNNVTNYSFVTFFGNVFVALFLFFICRISIFRKFYDKLIFISNKFEMVNLTVACVFVMVIMNFFMATIYFKLQPIFLVIINSVLIFVYSYIIYRSLNEKNNSMIVKALNDSLLDSLQQYEDMVDRQRVDNHENKNQLLIIMNMIKKNDKDVVKYIDTIVKDQKEDDEVLYTRVMAIPSGGLQGIIYQKMLVMKDERILFSLDVSRDVRKIDLNNFSMEDNYRLCKIVGVFLDNAIEESLNIDDKRVMISLYVDDGKLVVDISNRFEGTIDVDKLDNAGYTTKSDGHGYGLSLVKKILSETDLFENERVVKNNIFKQIVRVKIKNT